MTECTKCGEEIEGDIMLPEGPEGLMHPSCWTEWAQGVENGEQP